MLNVEQSAGTTPVDDLVERVRLGGVGSSVNGTYFAEKVFLAVERWRRASSRMFSSARRRFFWGEGELLEELVMGEGSNVEEEEVHEITVGVERLNFGWF